MTTSAEKFVVYWLGYHPDPPDISSLPKGIDVINLFLLNLTTSSNGTTIDYDFITSKGTSWDTILTQPHAAQANGVKVCVSILPPNSTLIWNTIPDPDVFAKTSMTSSPRGASTASTSIPNRGTASSTTTRSSL